jgi:hypothetical protein
VSIRILVLAMGQLSNGEMTIAHSCMRDLDPARFHVRFVSHARGADYLTKLGAVATGVDGLDPVRNRAAVRRLVEEFRPQLLVCADVYTLDYGSTWSGVDFSWLRTFGLPIATFDEYDWEDGDFLWDTADSSRRVNPGLVRGCDLLIRPCPLSDPDKPHPPHMSSRPPAEVIRCRLIPRRESPSMSRADWRAALNLRDSDRVVFTVNSSWEYVNVSMSPHVARLIEWMPRISAELLASVAEPLTVVHVGPRPWIASPPRSLDYRHFEGLPPDLYQATTHYADLFFGTNATSITLSNAVMAGTPSVLLHNPRPIDFGRLGEVLPRMPQWYQDMAADVMSSSPFRVFPWGWTHFLENVLHRENPYLTTFAQAPVFVPAKTLATLNGLLFDPDVAAAQRRRQRTYFDRLDGLPPLGESIEGALKSMGVSV